jgi:GNAT superfamily N-acetyltransferase
VLHTYTLEGPVTLGLAITRDDVDQAERLVHEVYVGRGFRDATRPRRRPALTLRTTVFLARTAGAVVGTLSLVRDLAGGLPADSLYGAELQARRAGGRRLAEVSGLVVDPSWRGAPLALVRPLVQLLGVYARDIAHVDELCIAVHPRHAAFYERRLGFIRFGREKAYGAVNGAPAVGLRLDLREPPIPGALSGSLFGDADIPRVRAALDADLRRQAAATGPLVKMLQFRQRRQRVTSSASMEVC